MKRTKKLVKSKNLKLVDFINKIDANKEVSTEKILEMYNLKRINTSKSISEFKFDKSRVKMLNSCKEMKEGNFPVVYWMFREQRVQDNWALLFSQHLALKYNLPLLVCFFLPSSYRNYTLRQYDFMIHGLEQVYNELKELSIPFHMLLGDTMDTVKEFTEEHEAAALITDFLPISPFKDWVKTLANELPSDVSVCQVDAHNIVPCWVASEKQEYAAKTIRPKIMSLLHKYLTEYPPVIFHEYNSSISNYPQFNKKDYFKFIQVDPTVPPLDWIKPGYTQGLVALENFVHTRLCVFADSRNDAVNDQTSCLSPYFHFGHLSPQRAILRSLDFKEKLKKHIDIFIEEAVVRRELTDNYCFYKDKPEDPSSAPSWALKTLEKHIKDKRPYIYDRDELEGSNTHDPIWNAAQNQLKYRGKMSGYLRMYWAKKILEWTKLPQNALEISLFLNDKYSIDGNDPNGIVGCMWAIYGLHDRPWGERSIFGFIRFMNETGCKRHFNVESYINKYISK